MKTVLSTILLSLLLVAYAGSQEPSKAKAAAESPDQKTRVAIVNLQRITNSGINYEKIRLLSLDKPTLDALKKINAEIHEVQTQVVDADDDTKLAELSRRMNFLNQKSMLLRQRAMNMDSNRDIQGMIRKFVIDTFKGKYALIIQQQQDSGYADRVVWKAANVEVDDITDDVREEFQKYMDQAGEGPVGPAHRIRPAIAR
jgi:hypothetical protein